MNHLNSGKNKKITFRSPKSKPLNKKEVINQSKTKGYQFLNIVKKLAYSLFILFITIFVSIIVIQSLIAISVQFCNSIVSSQLDVPDQNIANMSIIGLMSALISWYLIGFKPYQKIDKLVRFMDNKLKRSLSTEVKENNK